MSHETNHSLWSDVDNYLQTSLQIHVDELNWVIESNAQQDLPAIDVSPLQGKFLAVMIRSCRATRVLEIGTLGGYSSIWMARALPENGRLVTIEFEKLHAQVAARHLEQAGVADKVDLRQGSALDVLVDLANENLPPFEFVFVDADKTQYAEYFERAMKLVQSGSTIVFDNTVRQGDVCDLASDDPYVQGVHQLHSALANNPAVDCSAVQTVGAKGHDGFTIAHVL